MSFPEQERALFDLLFDKPLRDRFSRERVAALAGFDLDEDERRDFEAIRADALVLDAYMRADHILSHVCRSYPLTFSIVSSLPGGLDLLRKLVDTRTMRTPPRDRLAAFGSRLRELLGARRFDTGQDKHGACAVAETELGMAMTAASLRGEMAAGAAAPAPTGPVPECWQELPLQLAPFVSAAVIPGSWPALKQALCPCPDTELWAHLSGTPLTARQRTRALAGSERRLLMARAHIAGVPACDTAVEHVTVELSEGFAPLLPHIDGKTSTRQILDQMRRIGAPEALLGGIESGFQQMLKEGMLIRAN